jgi:hypothetical protein
VGSRIEAEVRSATSRKGLVSVVSDGSCHRDTPQGFGRSAHGDVRDDVDEARLAGTQGTCDDQPLATDGSLCVPPISASQREGGSADACTTEARAILQGERSWSDVDATGCQDDDASGRHGRSRTDEEQRRVLDESGGVDGNEKGAGATAGGGALDNSNQSEGMDSFVSSLDDLS